MEPREAGISTWRWDRRITWDRRGDQMRPILALALLLIMIAGCMPEGGSFGASTGLENMVPDPKYSPQAGDRAFLFGMEGGYPIEKIPVLSDLTAYDKYERYRSSGDSFELGNL